MRHSKVTHLLIKQPTFPTNFGTWLMGQLRFSHIWLKLFSGPKILGITLFTLTFRLTDLTFKKTCESCADIKPFCCPYNKLKIFKYYNFILCFLGNKDVATAYLQKNADFIQATTAFYEEGHSTYCQIMGRVQTCELEKMGKVGVILISFILSEIDGKD